MTGNRQDRQRQRRHEALERAMDALAAGAREGTVAAPADLERLFFQDHAELVASLEAALERSGLAEACLAWARFLEEDREHWLRRLERIAAEPALRARREALEQDWRTVLADHFHRWGAAGTQGERVADLEAELALAALRGAERLWLRGRGRPVLPVLVQEALEVVWPALYQHARRHRR